jgi:hypothetical protein
MAKDDDGALVVLTKETRRDILGKGGSGHWVINPKSVDRCQYLVCCRRALWENRSEKIPHRTAFLVGRIAALTKLDKSENERGQARFLIGISDYAEIDIPNVWRKELRNPVAYDTLKHLGIKLSDLKFRAVARSIGGAGEPARMTIAQAKEALAATFGVKPEDVEIIIRG